MSHSIALVLFRVAQHCIVKVLYRTAWVMSGSVSQWLSSVSYGFGGVLFGKARLRLGTVQSSSGKVAYCLVLLKHSSVRLGEA